MTVSRASNPHYIVTIMSALEGGNTQGYKPVLVQAPMPESFMYDASVQYEAPFTQGLTGNPAIDTILRVGVASKLITQSMTAQIWQGSTETDLGLELEFQAEYNPVLEVREPIMQLMRLVTPSVKNGGLITSPGPKLDEKVLSDLVSIYDRTKASLTSSNNENVPVGAIFSNMIDSARTVPDGGSGQKKSSDPADSKTFGTVDYFKTAIKDQISIRVGSYALFDSVVITSVQKTYESQFDPATGWPWFAKVSVRFKPLFMVVQEDLDRIFSPPPTFGIPSTQTSIPIGASPSNNQGSSGATTFAIAPPTNPIPIPLP